MTTIIPFLMFEGRAQEAINFYTSLFPDSAIVRVTLQPTDDSVLQAIFTLAGQPFMALDSSVHHDFTFTPSLSLFVNCDSEEELDRLYAALSEGGVAMMPLGNYSFSQKFGWVADRFGVSWQLNLP